VLGESGRMARPRADSGRDCPTVLTTLDELPSCEGLDESAGVDGAKVKHAIPKPLQAEAHGAWVGGGIKGATGTGKTIIDDYVGMIIPAEMGSLIPNGSDRGGFWGFVRIRDSIEIYEVGGSAEEDDRVHLIKPILRGREASRV